MADLPDYEPELAAAHQVFRVELSRAIGRLQIPADSQVLDVACGDGFYSRMLSEALQGQGAVVGIDKLPEYIEEAKVETRGLRNVEIREGDAYSLDFEDRSIDWVWCAQSLMTLDDCGKALSEIKRVLKASGQLAILEQDQAHELILPWPPRLESAIQQALWRESQQSHRKAFVARTLRANLQQAGFVQICRTSATADRTSPLDADCRSFLQLAMDRLMSRVRGYLSPADWREFHAILDPHEPDSFFNRGDLEMTYLFWVWTAHSG